MYRLLLLQIRRFGVTLALLAAVTPLWALTLLRADLAPGPALSIAVSAMAALFAALSGLIVAAAATPSLRGWRVASETGALGAFCLAIPSPVLPVPGWAYLLLWPLVSTALWCVLYGPLAPRLPGRRTATETARIRIPLPHQMVWRMALPTRPAEHWDPLLRSSIQDAEDADTFHLDYASGGGRTDAVTITMLEIEPNRGYRYLFQGEASGVCHSFAQGMQRVLLFPDGEDATFVELSRVTEETLPSQRLLSWLDRAPEDYARFLLASTLGEPMTGTLAGQHRLAVLREELAAKRRSRAGSAAPVSRAAAFLRTLWSAATRAPSMMSW